MERFISGLVKDFESGKLSRRQFCETVALAATVYAAGDAAKAAPARGFKMLGVNHISYSCPDYARVRDWYISVLGMEVAPEKDNGKRANLMFGPEPGKGGTFLIPRNFTMNAAPPAQSVVDHICYTVRNWNDAHVNNTLKAHGLNPTGRSGSVNMMDPFNYHVQIASAEAENPFN